MNNMHEEKSHDWEEIYANCDFGLSSEPRAKDVRRKPILAERERWRAKGYERASECETERQGTTSERDKEWNGVERWGVNVLKKIAKKKWRNYTERADLLAYREVRIYVL